MLGAGAEGASVDALRGGREAELVVHADVDEHDRLERGACVVLVVRRRLGRCDKLARGRVDTGRDDVLELVELELIVAGGRDGDRQGEGRAGGELGRGAVAGDRRCVGRGDVVRQRDVVERLDGRGGARGERQRVGDAERGERDRVGVAGADRLRVDAFDRPGEADGVRGERARAGLDHRVEADETGAQVERCVEACAQRRDVRVRDGDQRVGVGDAERSERVVLGARAEHPQGAFLAVDRDALETRGHVDDRAEQRRGDVVLVGDRLAKRLGQRVVGRIHAVGDRVLQIVVLDLVVGRVDGHRERARNRLGLGVERDDVLDLVELDVAMGRVDRHRERDDRSVDERLVVAGRACCGSGHGNRPSVVSRCGVSVPPARLEACR